MINKIKKIANHYLLDKQQRQLAEECAELIQATSKYVRFIESKTTRDEIIESSDDGNMLLQNIIEEIADVEVMLDQIKYLIHINPEAIESIKKIKVNRELARIEQSRTERR
jgi:NTP pyrophosphatase (non-canonical NTP hydrolase)